MTNDWIEHFRFVWRHKRKPFFLSLLRAGKTLELRGWNLVYHQSYCLLWTNLIKNILYCFKARTIFFSKTRNWERIPYFLALDLRKKNNHVFLPTHFHVSQNPVMEAPHKTVSKTVLSIALKSLFNYNSCNDNFCKSKTGQSTAHYLTVINIFIESEILKCCPDAILIISFNKKFII